MKRCGPSDFRHPIGGTSRLATSKGRHVVDRLEACCIEARKIDIIERDVPAEEFDSLQQALDCITKGDLGCINLIIPAGVYMETIALSDSSGAKLTLCGPLEPQYSRGYQNNKEIIGPPEFGTGVVTLSSAANVITIATTGDAPALTQLNIVGGDTIEIQNNSGDIVRRTIDSVTDDTITLTSSVSVGPGTASGFVFLPKVHINGSIDTQQHVGKFILKGIFVSSPDDFAVKSTVAPVCLQQSTLRVTDTEASEGALSLKGAAIPRSDLLQSALFGARGLTVERIHGIEAREMMIFVEDSTQEGWGIHLNEASFGFLEDSHVAGEVTGSLILTQNESFLDIERSFITVNLDDYDGRMVRADINSTINIHDDSILEFTDPDADARHASAINTSRLTVCGEVEFIGDSVATQSAVEAANGSMVTSDHSNITFTDIVAGDEYDVDTLTGIGGSAMAAAPIVGPSDSNAIINDKF